MGDTPPDTRLATGNDASMPRTAERRQGRRVTPQIAATVAVLSAAVTAGCSMQPGKEAVNDFAAWHADHPLDGVTSDSAQANDVLPGVGNATIHLTSTGSSTPEEALEHYCSYVSGTFVYFDLQYPVRPLADDPRAGQVTVTLPCEEPQTFHRSSLVENLKGLELADLRDQPQVSFSSPAALAGGLRKLAGSYDARELTLTTEDLYVRADVAAEPEAVAAAADIVELARDWPVNYLVLNAGNVNYPAVLNVQVSGNKAQVRELVDQIVDDRGLPSKYAVNVTTAPERT